VRAVLTAALLAALTVAAVGSGSSSAAGTPPTITLLTPANGSTILSSVGTTTYPTFSWHVDWATPENALITWEIASDTAFTQKVTIDNQSCPATNVNCWSSFQPHAVYGPPYGSVWYWRVGVITSAGTVYSSTFTFTAVNPPDGDRDGVPDSKDNCPKTANADQRDSNHDGKGDACQPDLVKPRVRVVPGKAKRGQQVFITAHAADDRGSVRLLVTFAYKQHVLSQGSFTWRQSLFGDSQTFFSRSKLSRSLPSGPYSACVEAWDRAGNHATDCAVYRVT
jgi:hypothetical protein